MSQLDLFTARNFEAWQEFHAENPEVYRYFVMFANQALQAGRSRFNARAIYERIRWHVAIETTDREYKLNNNHAPYYSRLLAGSDDRFRDFFEFRNSRFDSSIEEVVEFHATLCRTYDPLES